MGSVFIIPNFYPSDSLGSVTLKNSVDVKAISIVGNSAVTGTTATYNVSFYPLATTQRGITWSIISGGSYATINSSTGVLTILSGASSSSVTIKATSTADSSITATKTITVTYNEDASDYDATLYYSKVNELTEGVQTIDFDVIAEDNWMILSYRQSCTLTGSTKPADYFVNNGGFCFASITTNKFYLESATTSSASKWTAVYSNSSLVYAPFAIKKENGVYYYTINGTDWVSFSSYYFSGQTSSTLSFAMGANTRFSAATYEFYIYQGVDDTLVSDFFAERT